MNEFSKIQTIIEWKNFAKRKKYSENFWAVKNGAKKVEKIKSFYPFCRGTQVRKKHITKLLRELSIITLIWLPLAEQRKKRGEDSTWEGQQKVKNVLENGGVLKIKSQNTKKKKHNSILINRKGKVLTLCSI